MASVLRTAVASLVLLSGAGLGRTAGLGESINRWVGQLGDDNFRAREQAAQKLWAARLVAERASLWVNSKVTKHRIIRIGLTAS